MSADDYDDVRRELQSLRLLSTYMRQRLSSRAYAPDVELGIQRMKTKLDVWEAILLQMQAQTPRSPSDVHPYATSVAEIVSSPTPSVFGISPQELQLLADYLPEVDVEHYVADARALLAKLDPNDLTISSIVARLKRLEDALADIGSNDPSIQPKTNWPYLTRRFGLNAGRFVIGILLCKNNTDAAHSASIPAGILIMVDAIDKMLNPKV